MYQVVVQTCGKAFLYNLSLTRLQMKLHKQYRNELNIQNRYLPKRGFFFVKSKICWLVVVLILNMYTVMFIVQLCCVASITMCQRTNERTNERNNVKQTNTQLNAQASTYTLNTYHCAVRFSSVVVFEVCVVSGTLWQNWANPVPLLLSLPRAGFHFVSEDRSQPCRHHRSSQSLWGKKY